MADITIRFVTESDPVSLAIRLETWSQFSHVEFILDDNTALGAHAKGGVKIRPIDYAKFTNEERYKLTVTDQQKTDILDFAHKQVGKPYDFTDIAGILFHRDWRTEDKWICSELVASAFEHGGFPLLYAPIKFVHRISPAQLYLSPYLLNNRIWPI